MSFNECHKRVFDFKDDPIHLLEIFKGEPHVFFLDSSQNDLVYGRYSFLGFDPYEVCQQKKTKGLSLLRERFNSLGGKNSVQGEPVLTAGMVGYLGYDWGLNQEKIVLKSRDDLGFPDYCFGFYDCILIYDHLTHKLHVTSSGLPETNSYYRQKRSRERLNRIIQKLSVGCKSASLTDNPERIPDISLDIKLDIPSNFTPEEYCRAVSKALEYIRRGDIYQVNLSQRFMFDFHASDIEPVELYKLLRKLSPSSFGGYLDCGSFQIISSSPEQFLRLDGRRVITRPMKGTRPRGCNPSQDRLLERELLFNDKEKAELLMITDLERNDLGKVCRYGSVKVKELRRMEKYRTVFQTTATIEGQLKESHDCFDLLEACFPGGSVTGCPKIRAMEIIEELEPTRRGIYTGSLGFVGFSGNLDFNILIRTLLVKDNRIYFQTGGGIVADSQPAAEYQETLIKAQAMRQCLEHVFCPHRI